MCSSRTDRLHCTHSDDSLFIGSGLDTRVTFTPYFTNLVAEPMKQVHAELFRLAAELESVRGQVQTECNAIRGPSVVVVLASLLTNVGIESSHDAACT